ncbi:tRNA 2-thiouridine(34) synthase MnmA [Marinobacter nanhaiticus D15-8W]|uniref:tRNA-specific 2-thiouridylase MnmA n=1 Tax=Marinobacter nanhaiticus D15-8W TaxID=626887 RepID=N6WQ97_9GAMM|nr:tRNA 2-thiouridine(34) synthase MnmA [Marinobacter nanhaiticus]ENO13731.1 tRNA 2-thiouridine(34) synthase MnmA [Marinobacter nanhaiticus D15-8W]BES71104.1 tRNA 2-thiouridine(34) synthase MnmA [Marinobacter nanhaiticus D15-8W]
MTQHTPQDNRNTRVIVGMSGGVDSSVAALLLKEKGYAVEGLFMKNWDEDDGTEYCTAMTDLADAQMVADKIGIPLHTASFAAEYWDRVFEHFLSEYRAGRTPNPDILCNKEVKFRAFLDYAVTLGADYIATGHYARRDIGEDGVARLIKGLDPNKDQSYFLHAVSGERIARTLFPVGEIEKPEVRRVAEAAGLVTHDKKDSTGICFIGERKFRDFLKQYIPAQPGNIETPTGDVIGRHQGLMYHTIGQRQGLGIGGLSNYNDDPWYVAEKDLDRNVLIAVQGKQHPLLFARGLVSGPVDWVAARPPATEFRCHAKTRYRQPDQACRVRVEGTGCRVIFDEAQRAVTPGQSVVFYDGDVCLGGGVIETTWRDDKDEPEVSQAKSA